MPLTHKQIEKILKDLWFRKDRTNWSHQIRYGKNNRHTTIPLKKEYRIWTALNILKQVAKASNLNHKEIIKNYRLKL
jgi:predicted RNA binding protein YcfA (HicA-like mRNA interferase family)